jgi:RNA polymerase sigma-70 factor (ECF subfamily)
MPIPPDTPIPLHPDIRLLCDEQDGSAWTEFVRAIEPRLKAEVRATLRRRGVAACAEDVEEIVQGIHLRLVKDDFRLLRSFDPRLSSLSTWLAKVAKSAALDHLRRQPRVSFFPLEDAENVSVAAIVPLEPLEFPEGVLTPRESQILQLVFEEGLSTEEAAREMGIAPKTAFNHKSSALSALRNYLDGESVK